MKVLAGELTETVYYTPSSTDKENGPLKVKSEKTYQADQVTYISDDIGLHRVHNPHPQNVAVSLHCKFPSEARTVTIPDR